MTDDGTGFTTGASTDGFGLLGMRERVALLDGHLEIDSGPGAGTSLNVTLPVLRRPAEAVNRLQRLSARSAP